jgi:hypothetical protein
MRCATDHTGYSQLIPLMYWRSGDDMPMYWHSLAGKRYEAPFTFPISAETFTELRLQTLQIGTKKTHVPETWNQNKATLGHITLV